jgi:hypothetical protein
MRGGRQHRETERRKEKSAVVDDDVFQGPEDGSGATEASRKIWMTKGIAAAEQKLSS